MLSTLSGNGECCVSFGNVAYCSWQQGLLPWPRSSIVVYLRSPQQVVSQCQIQVGILTLCRCKDDGWLCIRHM